MVPRYDMYVYRGDPLYQEFDWTDNDEVVDLTDIEARMQIRNGPEQSQAIITEATVTLDNELPNVVVELTGEQTQDLRTTTYYDIELRSTLTPPAFQTWTWLRGSITAEGDVTRD